MSAHGDTRRFKNEDLVLKVSKDIDPAVWDEAKYEPFLDELCGFREFQKVAIRTTLRFLLGGRYRNLKELAKENFSSNVELQELYGSWAAMERCLQLPDHLSCSIDQATGTGKSYVLYGVAAILLAEGVVDRVLVLCPSKTIEDGLLQKFRGLAGNSDLADLLPAAAKVRLPSIINATGTIVEDAICVENYHAILESVGSSIRQSLRGKGERVAVLNDEAHHVANESGSTIKKWKEFLLDPQFGFKFVVGVSGTCYVGNEYFSDVVFRYAIQQAIEEKVVKRVEYVDELPPAGEDPEEKWQLIYNRHADWKRRLKSHHIRPLTIVVTRDIRNCEQVEEELREFLQGWEEITEEQAREKVLAVTSARQHQPNVARLKTVDSDASKVEWIVSVSMLSEGWDVKNVFQIVPHEERAFNSKLLIAQVLGRGLRRPNGWTGEEPIVTVFNHDSWSGRIKQLVNEILERDQRLSSHIDRTSRYNFDIHQLDYTREEDTTEYVKKGGYRIFDEGYIDLPTQVEQEDVVVEFEEAVSGKHSKFKTTVQHRTYPASVIALEMHRRLKSLDDESVGTADATSYAKEFTVQNLERIVSESLKQARIRSGCVTEQNKQRFLAALRPLRRKAAKRVLYRLTPKMLVTLNTKDRQEESCNAAGLRRGSKTVIYPPECEGTLSDEQKDFFREVVDPDGDFVSGRIQVPRTADFKTPANLVIADGTPERKFLRTLVEPNNAEKLDAWLKNTAIGFYHIEYAWKKGEHPKRGEFSPDLFLKQDAMIFMVEIKGDEEIKDPAPDNVKKYEYATQHFKRLNAWLEKERIPTRYQFNMLTAKDFNKFFHELRDRSLVGFRSELDVTMSKAAQG